MQCLFARVNFFYVYEGKIVMPLGLGGLGQLRIRFRS
jgi:hypothetical protein